MKCQLTHKMSGYTLIEILIVLFIVSIVTTVAILSISHNESKQLETFTNELTQMLSLAEEQALLEPRVLGLLVSENKIQFASLQQTTGGKQVWVLVQEHTLAARNIPANIYLTIETGNHQIEAVDQLNPQIIISTNGEITPFIIYIGKKGEKPRYAIVGDAGGNISNKSLI